MGAQLNRGELGCGHRVAQLANGQGQMAEVMIEILYLITPRSTVTRRDNRIQDI